VASRSLAESVAPVIPAVTDDQLQKWADRITRRYGKLVADVLALGNELTRIKARCPHGNFERMFSGDVHAVANPVPFGIRTAQMFMAIANHPILSQASHGTHLPNSYRTLYELSRLSTSVLTKALEERLIHPEMERQDVGLLKEPREQARQVARTSPRADANAKREISDVLKRLWQKYPSEHAFLLREVAALSNGTMKDDEEKEETR
jgi:hypothetical protein